jgi:4-hydroxy-tetrahydrodipicolinate synthase
MTGGYFISAICTLLDKDDQLHIEGLHAHLDAQWSAGINGVLVGGTMGLMQLLSEQTYQQLCIRSIELTKARGEVLIGAGDTSVTRTLARVQFLNSLKGVDGVVVLAPFFMTFTQDELQKYFTSIADVSKAPVFLYDVPHWTRNKIEPSTVLKLAKHPNIHGIKCSDHFASAKPLLDAGLEDFRVIIAQPLLVDTLLRAGVAEHLDGIYGLAPKWTRELGSAAGRGDWQTANHFQQKLAGIAAVLGKYGVFAATTAILNASGVAGKACPEPYILLSDARRQELLQEPTIKELLQHQNPSA